LYGLLLAHAGAHQEAVEPVGQSRLPAYGQRVLASRYHPQKAIKVVENPALKALGDYRWTPNILLATWHMAETSDVPPEGLGYNHEVGDAEGGVDHRI
jgi:hypothetical protein